MPPIDRSLIHFLSVPPGCPLTVTAARVPTVQKRDTTKRFVSGWGLSRDEAIENCACELAERLSAQINGDEDIRRACADSLGAAAIPPPAMMLIGREQYLGSAHSHVMSDEMLLPWQAEQEIDWVAATTYLSMQPGWLAAGLCFLGHAGDRDAGLLPADSNGLAAGSSVEDAAIRAFCELVERDAVAIWWYHRLVRPRIDPGELADPVINLYADWSRERGRPLRLIDLTHDVGLPVVAALTHDLQGAFTALGFGAGITASLAARHAIGELTQFECNIALIEQRISLTGEDAISPEARRLLYWWRQARLNDYAYLANDRCMAPPTAISALDLAGCHDLCRKLGLTFFAIDMTRPTIGVPVVRVVVPGLRPMSPRFAPGRLYDVPIKLNWLSHRVDPADLNPTPMMF